MRESTPFSPQTVGWLVGLGFLAFFGALLMNVLGGDRATRTAEANPFSHSAIGHAAFVETLRASGVPTVVSRADSHLRASGNLLVLAEPPGGSDPALLDELLGAGRVLVVLPKWTGAIDRDNPRWLAYAELRSAADVDALLERVAPDAEVVRTETAGGWSRNAAGATPTASPLQLVRSESIEPLVAGPQGVLLGAVRNAEGRVWVLSDPDVLNNHGLGKGDNAAFAVDVVRKLLPRGGAAVFDATAHGFERTPSLWRALFGFPFVIATIITAATVAVLMWAAAGRFGAPRPPRPPFEAGKAKLIRNTATLLNFGGHAPELLARYFRASLRDVARRVHAPRHLDEAGLLTWLDNVADARGIGWRASDLARQAEGAPGAVPPDDPRIAHTAYAIYRWKREMIDGPGRHPEAR